jgi:hypothetical protein
MTNKLQFPGILIIVLITSLFWISSAHAGREVSGKTFYTKANIWYEKPEKIFSTNYHSGAILPVGTKVLVKKVRKKEIKFVDDIGETYIIIFLKKYSSPKMNVWDYFDQYFSLENPMKKGGPFEKFTKEEQENINMGIIEEGMSKAAVLMSYGYPPSHRTRSIKSAQWIYWENRFRSKRVIFKDGKVLSIGR